MRHQVLLLTTCLLATAATAQRRSVGSTLLLPEVQAELALTGDDYILLGVRGPISTGTFQGTTLEQVGLNLGYERFWNEQWSGGATLRSDFYKVERDGGSRNGLYTNLTPELFVRHWNTLGGFNFRQRLGVEVFVPTEEGAESRAITRLRLDLDRVFPLGTNLALRPRISYEAAAYLRLQRDELEEKERVIDFGNLRGEIGVRVSPHFDFTPWVASQTTYINALVQTDANGNVTGGGRTNLITPVVGLDLRFTLFKGGSVFERRQLPTQH
ncbi:hypothetical protein [Hymenobacter yonginensis]|uniref:DUF2490 domain-containing protein n=1 Tax=Hymenobacter yonginensis TaxID=748197 RepID=A0ABY7PN39_9BACT|nr:hypothetical protein [Hymenobacter yonginensis]WBO83460.1 hypothetical protein O9Z63_13835 [Hymenobacter yonginensis]